MAAYSEALLRSSIVSRPPRNPELMAGYATGAIPTVPAMPLFKGIVVPPAMRPNSTKLRQARSYDRAKTWGRKRVMGGYSKMPNTVSCWFTEGERAVLAVIAGEVKKHGECTLSILAIARAAGVGVRLVQYTLDLARNGKIRPGRRSEPAGRPLLIAVTYRRKPGATRNDTSVITIVSREWLLWLNYRPSENPNSGCTEVRPNSILKLKPLSHSENDRPYRASGPPQGAYENRSDAPTARRSR